MTLGDLRFPAPAIPKKLRWGHFSSIPGVFVRFPGAVAGRRTLRTLCFESRFSGVSSEKSAPGPLPCMAGAGNLRTPRAPNVNALRAKILTGGGSAMQLLSICSPVALLQLLRLLQAGRAAPRRSRCLLRGRLRRRRRATLDAIHVAARRVRLDLQSRGAPNPPGGVKAGTEVSSKAPSRAKASPAYFQLHSRWYTGMLLTNRNGAPKTLPPAERL